MTDTVEPLRVFPSPHDLALAVGTEIGPGPWLTVQQHRVDLFAEATGDDQWIHVDPERAADTAWGGTIAHGFLTLSLVPALMRGLYRVDGVGVRLNYGLDRVRFPAPVLTGSAVRATARIRAVDAVGDGFQVVTTVTVESDRSAKPVCVADTVARVFPAAG